MGIAVVVDAFCPWLQARVSRSARFEPTSMVFAETSTYVFGGLALAGMSGGWDGMRRCVNPSKYVAFLPASLAFCSSNFCTYAAVRGLGASQFYLLVQLRVAVLAVMLRIWRGVRQTPLEWISLVQLAFGMLVLVQLRAKNELGSPCDVVVAQALAAVQNSSEHWSLMHARGMGGVGVAATGVAATPLAIESVVAASAVWSGYWSGLVALAGVIVCSAFAFIFMEVRLKSEASESIFVQQHQLNVFGAAMSLCINLHRHLTVSAGTALAQSASTVVAGNLTAAAADAATSISRISSEGGFFTGWGPQTVLLWMLCICRGSLCSIVLKRLDSVTKGLIDVSSIVLCSGLQIVLDGIDVDPIVVAMQIVLLLSITQYLVAKAQAPPQAPSRKERKSAMWSSAVAPSSTDDTSPSRLKARTPCD